MARKPTLSPSKFTTYLACPTKYLWTYLDSRGRWYLRSKTHYSFGTSLHAVLQRFHDEGDRGVTTTGEALAALEEGWIEAGYSSQEEMAQALSEGKEIVARYVSRLALEPISARTILVERTLRCDLGRFVLLGRVDRVDEHEDGSLEVVDYKTGRQTVLPEDVATDIAMGCYQLLLRKAYPGRPVRATILALRSGERASAAFTDEGALEFESLLVEIGHEILDRDFERHAPVPKPLCATCDFLPLCRKHPDFSLETGSVPGGDAVP